MNLAFISYWDFESGLCQATVIPHLHILEDITSSGEIHLYTFERAENFTYEEISLTDRITVHRIPAAGMIGILTVWRAFKKKQEKFNYGHIFCRSSFAGIIGYLAYKKFKISYSVESFEPHVEYMVESGTWSKFGIKSIVLRFFEKKEIKTAKYILPVSNNYAAVLIENGLKKERVKVMPCGVNIEKFQFNNTNRKEIRSRLGINENTLCGIYVGKFGGIYYDDYAFKLFKSAKKKFGDFFLILLSPTNEEIISNKMVEIGFNSREYFHGSVPFEEVPDYLSASDFAFSLHTPSASKISLSPIKNGEYWANGLPMIISEGIGDDSKIINNENAGIIISKEEDENLVMKELEKFLLNFSKDDRVERLPDIAMKNRSFTIISNCYKEMLNVD